MSTPPPELAEDPDGADGPGSEGARRRISRRAVVVGLAGLAGVTVTGVVAAAWVGSHHEEAAPPPTAPPETTTRPPPGGRARVEYPHDVPRVPQDPSTGVAGWPMDPAGAQLVQAPV